MSYSGVGGFQGGDALLAFAAIQQGRMNEEMTEAMRIADLRSQMSGELADIKAHLQSGIDHRTELIEVDKEMQAFLEKYGDEPALADVTATVRGIQENIHGQVEKYQNSKFNDSKLKEQVGDVGNSGGRGGYAVKQGSVQQDLARDPLDYNDDTIRTWMDQITEKLDASGTNDQLSMIHIKQLNDNINNSSGMVSGIIESRNNTTSSIINNIA